MFPERGPATISEMAVPGIVALLTEAASGLQRLEGERDEAHRLLDRLEQARTEGDGPDEETLNLAGRILNLACDHKAAEQALSASQKEVERLTAWRDENLRQLIAIRMVRPTHDDLCRLSVIFGRSSDLRTDQDIRINEWLKAQIHDASALQTGGKEHG